MQLVYREDSTMEEQEKDIRIQVQEAMKDAEWVKKVLHSKFTEELCFLFWQKGIEISEQEMKKLVSRAITSKIIELNDRQLQVSRGELSKRDHWQL